MTAPSRRDFLSVMASSAILPWIGLDLFPRRPQGPQTRALRIRTITAGVGLRSPTELQRVETAIAMLERAKRVFQGEDYEVQTLIMLVRKLRNHQILRLAPMLGK